MIGAYVIIATRPSPGPFQTFTMAHRGAEDCGLGAWALPPSIAFSTFAESRACSTTGTAGVPIVAGKSCGKFFLTQLLRLVQADDQLLGSQKNAVHTVHRSGGWVATSQC